MFPSLRRLNLSGNQRLSGSLPPSWGSETGSFQNLAKFDAASCALNGSLPEGWPTGLPALADVNLSSNALTGTHSCTVSRPAWAFLARHLERCCEVTFSKCLPGTSMMLPWHVQGHCQQHGLVLEAYSP